MVRQRRLNPISRTWQGRSALIMISSTITKNKIGGLPGEFFIKNEGPQNKGPY